MADDVGLPAGGMLGVSGSSRTELADVAGSGALGEAVIDGGAVDASQTERADDTGSGAPGSGFVDLDDAAPGHTEGADVSG